MTEPGCDNAEHRVGKPVGKTKDADFDLGFLTSQNLYQPARLRSKKADEQIYEIQVPAEYRIGSLTSLPVKADGVQLPLQALECASLAVNPPPGLVLRLKGVKAGK